MAVYVKRKLVSSNVDQFTIRENEALTDIVGRLGMPDILHDYLNVSIDGVVIPQENWMTTQATPRNVVYIAVVPQGGGGGGKNPLAAIAMIALAVFAAPTAFAWGSIMAGSTLGGYAAVAGVMFVGALAINALFPPPTISSPSTQEDSTGFFGMEGLRNRSRPHQAVRNIYGTYRVAPDIAAEPYIVTNSDLQILYALYDFGYGNITLSDIKIGNTAIADFGGYYSIHTNYTNGTLNYYKNDNVSESHEVELRSQPVARTAPSSDSDEVVVDISFPLGLAKFEEGGGVSSDTVKFWIIFTDVATNSDYGIYQMPSFHASQHVAKVDDYTITLTRTTSKFFVLSLTVTTTNSSEWKVTIQRKPTKTGNVTYYDTAAAWDDHWADKTVLTNIRSVTRVQPLDFKIPHTVLELRITATDKLSGMIDTLTATCGRVLPYYSGGVQVGTKVTSSHAWIALNILMGDENPDPIPASRINFTTFEGWAAFCGDLNTDADDYHADCNWDSKSTVFERLLSVMTAGRATIAHVENKYSVIYEQFPTVPSQLLTTANSWNFKGTKLFTKQPHALNVSFIDPDSEWQMVDRIVYADGYTESNATYFENISMPLCTSSDRAWKAGRYYLAQGTLRPESFRVTTDIENLVAERGDLITLQYDAGRIGGTPSRITAITGAVVTLREPTQWDEVDDWYLRIRKDDGTQEELQVISQTDSYTFTLSATPSPVAKVGDLVVYGQQNYVTDKFLVKSRMPHTDLTATFELVPIAYAIEDADTGTIPTYTPPITPEIMLYPECIAITDINIDSNYYFDYRFPFVDVILNWPDLGAGVVYEIWFSLDGTDNYELVETSKHQVDYILYKKKSTLDFDYNKTDDQLIKIIPVNVFGYKSPIESCDSASFTLAYDSTLPGKPLFFAGNINADTINLTWIPPVDEDIAGYIIKYTTSNTPYWDNATAQGSIIPYNITNANYNARIGAYMIKTIDTSGNYSDEFGLIRTTVPALQGFDNFQTLTEYPSFSGTKSSVEVVTVEIYSDDFTSDIDDWTASTAILTNPSGKLRVTNNTANYGAAIGYVTVEIGKTYNFYVDRVGGTGTGTYHLGTTSKYNEYVTNGTSGDETFVAINTTLQIGLNVGGSTINYYYEYDNVLVNEATGLRLVQDEGNYVQYGTYNYNSIVDLGDVYNAYISSDLARTIINSGSETTLESYQDVIIQVKMSSENPSISDWVHIEDADPIGGATDEDWSGWQNLYAGYYTGRYFAFRAVLVSNKTFITPHVYELGIKVDMVERTEVANDVTSSGSGALTVTFANKFKDTPSIGITQDNASLGDYYNITNQSATGFDITFKDSDNAIQSRQFDWTATGYGVLLTSIDKPVEAGADDDISLLPKAVSFITKKELLN